MFRPVFNQRTLSSDVKRIGPCRLPN